MRGPNTPASACLLVAPKTPIAIAIAIPKSLLAALNARDVGRLRSSLGESLGEIPERAVEQ
jgi:hypothetical protein